MIPFRPACSSLDELRPDTLQPRIPLGSIAAPFQSLRTCACACAQLVLGKATCFETGVVSSSRHFRLPNADGPSKRASAEPVAGDSAPYARYSTVVPASVSAAFLSPVSAVDMRCLAKGVLDIFQIQAKERRGVFFFPLFFFSLRGKKHVHCLFQHVHCLFQNKTLCNAPPHEPPVSFRFLYKTDGRCESDTKVTKVTKTSYTFLALLWGGVAWQVPHGPRVSSDSAQSGAPPVESWERRGPPRLE